MNDSEIARIVLNSRMATIADVIVGGKEKDIAKPEERYLLRQMILAPERRDDGFRIAVAIASLAFKVDSEGQTD